HLILVVPDYGEVLWLFRVSASFLKNICRQAFLFYYADRQFLKPLLSYFSYEPLVFLFLLKIFFLLCFFIFILFIIYLFYFFFIIKYVLTKYFNMPKSRYN